MISLQDLVDLDWYPIDQADAPALRTVIAGVQGALAQDGCAVLRGFVHARGLAQLVAEADSVAGQAHLSFGRTNAYFSQDDPSLPPDHPAFLHFFRKIRSSARDHCDRRCNAP